MTDCSVSIDELNHDLNSNKISVEKLIGERKEEILGNCSLTDHEDKTQLIEEIVNSDELLGIITDVAWMFGFKDQVDNLPLHEVRSMAVYTNRLAIELGRLAKGIAESEL